MILAWNGGQFATDRRVTKLAEILVEYGVEQHGLLTEDPNQRLGARGAIEVKHHPYFREINLLTIDAESSDFVATSSSTEVRGSTDHVIAEFKFVAVQSRLLDPFVETESSLRGDPFIPGLPDDIALSCLLRLPVSSHVAGKVVCKRWYQLFGIKEQFFTQRKEMGFQDPWLYIFTFHKCTGKIQWHVLDLTHFSWHTIPQMPCIDKVCPHCFSNTITGDFSMMTHYATSCGCKPQSLPSHHYKSVHHNYCSYGYSLLFNYCANFTTLELRDRILRIVNIGGVWIVLTFATKFNEHSTSLCYKLPVLHFLEFLNISYGFVVHLLNIFVRLPLASILSRRLPSSLSLHSMGLFLNKLKGPLYDHFFGQPLD
ncbi:hypothetical protein M8C21_024205 [Ambrosia artemisiifolia]|uniref:F-box domain-containing protein n=1 Tax=Ambrosia artemisiifolia TaxID=4212 RepID=A0AAD5C1U5_AMBAR|nr:hypothetical protein M8C21_024205 [Ambrosia artemisiifolia]